MSARARRAETAKTKTATLATKVSPPARRWPMLAAIFASALSIRLFYLWQISGAPFFHLRLGDGESYHLWAQRIAAGDWLGSGVFYQAPLYPYFLSAIYRVFGDSVATVRVVQAVLGAGSCTLLAAAGSVWFGRAGMLAGFALAIFPPAIFLDGSIDKSALATFLMAALLLVLIRQRWVAAGAILGLLALTRENALLLAPVILLWIAFGAVTSRSGAALAFVAACALTLLPIAARNKIAGGEFHITTSQLGSNFYIGNHAGASGMYEALVVGHGNAADEREDATRLAEQATGHKLTPAGVSDYWLGRGLHYIAAQPLDWLRLTARKLALALNASEVADTESQEVYAEWSWLLRVLRPFDFGVLLGVAVWGAIAMAGEWRRLWLLPALGVGYLLSVALFYVLARYRFPLALVLLLIAAGGLKRLPRRESIIGAAAMVLATAFAHLPLDDARTARATNYLAIAVSLEKEPAHADAAADFYRRSLDADGRFPAAQFGLGTLLMRGGRAAEAIPHFQAALAVWPDYEEAHYNLARALAATGEARRAIDEYEQALRIRADDEDAEMGLAASLVAIERMEEAMRHLSRALELNPNDAAAHNSLGAALANQGHVAQALSHFERAAALNPSDENARRNVDRARQMLAKGQ